MVENPGKISVAESEIEIKAIRAQGSGGQNVNKVSSAIHLRFDIAASSLDDIYKERLLKLNDTRITREGVMIEWTDRNPAIRELRMKAIEFSCGATIRVVDVQGKLSGDIAERHLGEHVIASLRFGVNDNRTRAHSRIRRGSRVAARGASWLVVPSRRTFGVVPRR